MRIGGSTLDGISPGRRKVRLCLSLQSGLESVILDLKDVYYLPSSFSNLVSPGLLNDHDIYYDNKCKTLYDRLTKTVLAYAECWKNSFLLRPLNLSNVVVQLISTGLDFYRWSEVSVHQTSTSTNK